MLWLLIFIITYSPGHIVFVGKIKAAVFFFSFTFFLDMIGTANEVNWVKKHDK